MFLPKFIFIYCLALFCFSCEQNDYSRDIEGLVTEKGDSTIVLGNNQNVHSTKNVLPDKTAEDSLKILAAYDAVNEFNQSLKGNRQ